MTRLGPLVHRSVRSGSILLLVGALEFVAAMIVVQLGYPGYSLSANYISDLGNTVLSPWHLLFNVSIVTFGLLVVLGAVLITSAFPARGTRAAGIAALAIAGIGAMGVGLSPENVNIGVHSISALLAFGGGGIALLLLAIAMFRDTRWDGYRTYTMVSGLVTLVALVLFVAHIYAGLGVGGMERLVAAPELLWMFLASVHLLRFPTYAPTTASA